MEVKSRIVAELLAGPQRSHHDQFSLYEEEFIENQ